MAHRNAAQKASVFQSFTGGARADGAALEGYGLEVEAIKAVAHPKRLLILDLLSDGDERTVTELMELSGLAQSNLSQNLAVMREAGVLATRRDGNQVHYRVRDPRVLKAVDLLRAVAAEAAKDASVSAEREAAKRTARAGRVTALAALGLGGVIATLAGLCPLLVGGSAADVLPHVYAMVSSHGFTGLVDVCVESARSGIHGASRAAGFCFLC